MLNQNSVHKVSGVDVRVRFASPEPKANPFKRKGQSKQKSPGGGKGTSVA